VHAAWYEKESLVIERDTEKIVFTNPGSMLVSVDDYYAGGRSVCRNPRIQRFFALIGRGERAGSGAGTIASGWRENGWPSPVLETMVQPDRVRLTPLLTKKEDSARKVAKGSIGKNAAGKRALHPKRGDINVNNAILSILKRDGTVSASVISRETGLPLRRVQRNMGQLKKSGRIAREGSSRGGYWVVMDQ